MKLMNIFKINLLILVRNPLNLFFTIVASLFTLLPLVIISKLHKASREEYLFIVAGSLFWIFISQAIWTIGLSLKQEQYMGTLEQIVLSPTSLILVMLGKSIIPMLVNSTSLFIGIFILRNSFKFDISYIQTMLFLLISLPSIYGFAYIVSCLVLKFREIFALLQILVGTMMILSGVSQPVTFLPPFLQEVSKYLIFNKIITTYREIIINNLSIQSIYKEALFILISGLLINFISYILFKRFLRKIYKRGEGLYV